MPRYIDADALFDEVERYFDGLPIVVHHDMVEFIKNAPTVAFVGRMGGKWLFDDGSIATGKLQDKNVHCSICGHSAPGKPWWECHLELTDYCPNCGADMQERRKDA